MQTEAKVLIHCFIPPTVW